MPAQKCRALKGKDAVHSADLESSAAVSELSHTAQDGQQWHGQWSGALHMRPIT